MTFYSYGQHHSMQKTNFEGSNPGNLIMYRHVPKMTTPNTKLPLVIVLHGCTQNGKAIAKISEWNRLADEYNFIVLYPTQKRSNNISNCFNWFQLDDINEGTGELQSIINMIDDTAKNYNINHSKVFVYGVSAGATMGVALLAVYPEYFNAGAIFAGAPYKIAITKRTALQAIMNSETKSPKEWASLIPKANTTQPFPKLIVYHGMKDKVVTIQNSKELIKQWTYLHHIDTIPDKIIYNYKSAPVNRIIYTDTTKAEKVVFYELLTCGHQIPINPGKEKNEGGKKGLLSKDINYFSTYYVAKDFGLLYK